MLRDGVHSAGLKYWVSPYQGDATTIAKHAKAREPVNPFGANSTDKKKLDLKWINYINFPAVLLHSRILQSSLAVLGVGIDYRECI